MKYYLEALKKYAVFHGRSGRKAYWMYFLFTVVISLALSLVEGLLGLFPENEASVLSTIYQTAVLIPSIAVSVRRMHDVNKSGWFMLIPIYNFVLAVTAGTKGENRFGPDPYAGTGAGTATVGTVGEVKTGA